MLPYSCSARTSSFLAMCLKVISYLELRLISNSASAIMELITWSSSITLTRLDASGISMMTFFTLPFFKPIRKGYPSLRLKPALAKSGAFKGNTWSEAKALFITMRIMGKYLSQTLLYIYKFIGAKILEQ